MPPDRPKARPTAGTGSRCDDAAAGSTSLLMLADSHDAAGELAAWGAAVTHLHGLGLPAAVPEVPAAWLVRRGIRPDWIVAA
jgi:hypothetical protein